MPILISGSLAYDRILDYPGYFSDHILSEKTRRINLSFNIPSLKEHFGGTAGNIAYSLALLGERPVVVGSAGNDFAPYLKRLRKLKIITEYIQITPKVQTASAYIITDRADSQIAGFHVGAMGHIRSLPPVNVFKHTHLAIIAAEIPQNMVRLARAYQKHKIKYIFDPGQAITSLSRNQLLNCMKGAYGLAASDYEIGLVVKKSGILISKLQNKIPLVIETRGVKGSVVWFEGRVFKIPAVKSRKMVDPTGAGDAYRSGLLYGVTRGWPLPQIGRFASLTAVYAVECHGTQNHRFTLNELTKRYRTVFGDK